MFSFRGADAVGSVGAQEIGAGHLGDSLWHAPSARWLGIVGNRSASAAEKRLAGGVPVVENGTADGFRCVGEARESFAGGLEIGV
jgi:hypothetical protein